MNFLPNSVLIASLIALCACTSSPSAPDADAAMPPAETHARQAHRLAEAGRIDEARVEVERALAIDAAQPEALRERASMRHAAGLHTEALADIELAHPQRPTDMRMVGMRCVIRVAAERSGAGLEDCQRALLLPGNKANAQVSLGQAQLLLGDPRQALLAFNEALALQPNHMRARYGRGLARSALGDAAGAQDTADAVRRLPGAGREFHLAKVAS